MKPGSAPGHPDSLALWEATAGMPEELPTALHSAQASLKTLDVPSVATLRAVTLVGSGTGAIAAAAAEALALPDASIPVWVGSGRALPAFVDEHTLVVAVSCSGTSTETMAAARTALARRAPLIVVAPEGPLADVAASAQTTTGGAAAVAHCQVGRPGPLGRVALGAATVGVLAVLGGAGIVADPGSSIAAAATMLCRRRDALFDSGGTAQEVVRRIGRTIPLVYGAAGVGSVAARRWKAQVNLTAKSPTFWGSLPGVVHDELAGWGQGGDVTRQVMSMVLLRHEGEDPTTDELFSAVVRASDEVMADIVEVRAEGDDDLARFLDLVLLGDVVALHMAAREGVDPGPAPAVEDALRAADPRHAAATARSVRAPEAAGPAGTPDGQRQRKSG